MSASLRIGLIFLVLFAGPVRAQAVDPSTRELLAIINERSTALESRLSDREKSINQRFEANDKQVSAALASADRATTKAENASEKRFDGVNEFRASLKDQQVSFATRSEVDIRFKSIDDKIAANNQQITQLISRAEGASQLWGIITVIAMIVMAALTAFLTFRKRPAGH